MYVVVRHYKGTSALLDEVERRKADLERVIRGVPGLIAWYLVREGDGGFTVTVCQDQAGIKESITRAEEWTRQNLPSVGVIPEIIEGVAIASIGK